MEDLRVGPVERRGHVVVAGRAGEQRKHVPVLALLVRHEVVAEERAQALQAAARLARRQ